MKRYEWSLALLQIDEEDRVVEDLLTENPMINFDIEERGNEEVTVEVCQEGPTIQGPHIQSS